MEKNLLRGSAQNNNESESQPKLDGRNISESISSKKLGDDQSGILPDFSSELTRLYDLKEAGTTYYEVPNQNILTEKTVNTKRFESLTQTAIFADRRIQQLRFIQKLAKSWE